VQPKWRTPKDLAETLAYGFGVRSFNKIMYHVVFETADSRYTQDFKVEKIQIKKVRVGVPILSGSSHVFEIGNPRYAQDFKVEKSQIKKVRVAVPILSGSSQHWFLTLGCQTRSKSHNSRGEGYPKPPVTACVSPPQGLLAARLCNRESSHGCDGPVAFQA
jgi:hypothetical protein